MIDLANEVRASDGLVPTYVTRVGVSLNLKRGTDSYGIGEESFAKMTRYHRVSVYGSTFRTAAIGSRYLAWCIANELCEKEMRRIRAIWFSAEKFALCKFFTWNIFNE